MTLVVGVVALSACNSQNKMDKKLEKMELKSDLDSVSYALGVNLASNVSRSGMEEINTDALAKGILETLNKDKETTFTEEECRDILNEYFGKLQKAQAEKVIQEGKDFMAKNVTREEVTETPSGLQYEVLKAGTGKQPSASDKVTVHYHGTLIDGTVFDSSIERGQPATFGLNQVIRGWTEGLQLMKEGAKYKFYIPSELAYGERSPSPKIPANSTLVFEVELLNVGDPAAGNMDK